MAAGDLTQGRRLADRSLDELFREEFEPGDYCLIDGVVWAREPRGNSALMRLDGWETTVHEDGNISLSPSIFVNKDRDPPGWHGFLERGVWREV